MPPSVNPAPERQRKLQPIQFAENQQISRLLPLDTCLKGIQLRLSGSVVTTFASGTPVADALSTFDNIIPRIDVTVGGSRVVKSVRPHMLRMQQLFQTKVLAERKSSAAATAASGNNPTVDAGFTYGTTTQITTVAETVYLSFEHVYCESGKGLEETQLLLKGQPSAELKLTCAALASLLGFGNTAPVVFSASTLTVEIVTIEDQAVPMGTPKADWRQSTRELTYSAQQTNVSIDLPRGQLLSGVMFLTRDGAAGSATTASGKLRSNNVITNMAIRLNGQAEVKATTFQSLQAENRVRMGVSAPFASNVSILDGVAYWNMLQGGDIRTALNVMDASAQPQLFIDTGAAADVSYTNPASVTLMTEEVVVPR